ncbi:hypothetical protein N0V87_006374 [Didymella glomerata]|uniref:Uncharacterized protein n=1 Tax=Didymella glomerata TaxID=749621 RepID=A0A9W8WWR1_9PLEO|nr:hypothetical protein N0V87_006374 [Didymella glomerata]
MIEKWQDYLPQVQSQGDDYLAILQTSLVCLRLTRSFMKETPTACSRDSRRNLSRRVAISQIVTESLMDRMAKYDNLLSTSERQRNDLVPMVRHYEINFQPDIVLHSAPALPALPALALPLRQTTNPVQIALETRVLTLKIFGYVARRASGFTERVRLPDMKVFRGDDDEDYEKWRETALRSCKAYLKRCLERPAYDMIQDMKVTTYMEWIKEIDNCFNPCTSDKVKAALQPLAGNTLTQKKT